jgi:hypothetical protein
MSRLTDTQLVILSIAQSKPLLFFAPRTRIGRRASFTNF